jgi:hypothetical protein
MEAQRHWRESNVAAEEQNAEHVRGYENVGAEKQRIAKRSLEIMNASRVNVNRCNNAIFLSELLLFEPPFPRYVLYYDYYYNYCYVLRYITCFFLRCSTLIVSL